MESADTTIFNRQTLLVGQDTMDAIHHKRVIIFGVGGVGSWCTESLIRSGIIHLTIVDPDIVNITNINRQLQATVKTLGQPKVEVLRQRLLDINPDADITALQQTYSSSNAYMFHLDDYDYIIDAIDSVQDKVQLILDSTASSAKLFSSMGAALKMDPAKIRITEFWSVKGCPLARAIRKNFKKTGLYPRKKFQCVYSPELLSNNPDFDNREICPGKSHINGTIAHIPAIFGLTLASLVLTQ
ncbi:MAG: tRNA threonylcarbamoyladenosine dehydratase [Bacteroidaceae bacterium]|nr:tRNA threonylcarbamoyladenosine dehydratase [Bacteroidaceae bacterium]